MMDKDEAVQKLSKVARISATYAEDLYDSFFEKPVVPQYVANWYEENKEVFGYNLVECINSIPNALDGEVLHDFEKWILDEEDSLTTLVNMHQFGYEVEKEKRYTVRVKGIDGYGRYLNKNLDTQRWLFASSGEIGEFRTKHTHKELEDADFCWVFDCPGMEVKEVE